MQPHAPRQKQQSTWISKNIDFHNTCRLRSKCTGYHNTAAIAAKTMAFTIHSGFRVGLQNESMLVSRDTELLISLMVESVPHDLLFCFGSPRAPAGRDVESCLHRICFPATSAHTNRKQSLNRQGADIK